MTTYTYSLQSPTVYRGPRLVSNNAFKRSPLTGAIQTISRPGERWEYELTWDKLYGANREDVLAFFARLNGMEHRVKLSVFGRTQRGAFSGTPVVDGGSQTGNTLNVRGASTGVTNWARAGDFIEVANHLYQIVADADSDGTGDVALSIIPGLRSSPSDGASVETSDPQGTFILTSPVDPDNRRGSSANPIISSLVLSFVDDISA